jgi:hypothetical protein
MDLLFRSNIEYIENIPYKAIDVGRKKNFLCRWKYVRFLLLYKMPFYETG